MAIEFYVPQHAGNDFSEILMKIGEAARQHRLDSAAEAHRKVTEDMSRAEAESMRKRALREDEKAAREEAQAAIDKNVSTLSDVQKAYSLGGNNSQAAQARARASQGTYTTPSGETRRLGVDIQPPEDIPYVPGGYEMPKQTLPGYTESGGGDFMHGLFQKLKGPVVPEAPPQHGVFNNVNDQADQQFEPPNLQLQAPEGMQMPTATRTPEEAYREYSKQSEEASGRPKYTILSSGQTGYLDPGEAQRFTDQQNQDRADKARALLIDPRNTAYFDAHPQERDRLMMQASMTGAGMSGAERAAVNNTAGQESSQGFKRELDTRDHMTADQQFQIGMRPRGNGGVNHGLNDLKKEQEIDKGHWDAARTIANELGFVDVQKDDRKLQDLAEKAGAAGHSAAMAAMVKGAFVKYAQGGTGVVSDSDMRVFWDSIGGVLARSGQSWENLISGHLTPEIKKQVEDALRSCVKQTESHYDPVGNGIVQRMSTAPGMTEGKLGTILQALVPSYYSKWRGQRANAGAPDALKEMDDWANHQLGGGR